MADDLMVWNITRDKITERMTVVTDNAWDTASPDMPPPPDYTVKDIDSDWLNAGRWDVSDVEEPYFRDFKQEHGLK